jgi:hypothetical protein
MDEQREEGEGGEVNGQRKDYQSQIAHCKKGKRKV